MQRILLSLLITLLACPVALAEVTLPSVFCNHVVLQRDRDVRVWGKAEPGEQVSVSLVHGDFPNAKRWGPAESDKDGNWQVMLPKQSAGVGYQLTITGSKTAEPIVIDDVAFGEVWVASGQSNMSWTVASSNNAKEEIDNSDNDQVRMWTAVRTVKTEPAFDVNGSWAVASPQTTGNFSAVGYYFARKLQKELGVPVGILHASWGGTPIEAWTSRDKLQTIDWAKPILERYEVAVKAHPQAKAEFDRAMKRWEETRNGPAETPDEAGYLKPDFDDAKWPTMALPQSWEKAGVNKDGVLWFRKTIDLPPGLVGQDLKLSLGPIDDGDTTYVNGEKVGELPASVQGGWKVDRLYNVPAKVVVQGKLTIAVRVVDLAGEGGIWGKPEQLTLARADAVGEAISLAGAWKYLVAKELDAKTRPTRRPVTPYGPEHPHSPAGLFNGMLAPIVPYTIQGAIWYQGEHNAPRAEQYEKLFPGLIEDWRARWGQGDFPFLFVQLANYRAPSDKVEDTDWAHLRDAQLKTLREVKNTGMAVTIDIGAANDIHPKNKQDVGIRLARWALADTYGKDVVKCGPIFNDADPDQDNKQHALLRFETFGSGLKVRGDGPLRGFSVSDGRGNFVLARAELVQQDNGKATVVRVWSDDIKQPYAVRYAWEDNPDEANLVNEEGLPASPFRTDDWKGPTDGRR